MDVKELLKTITDEDAGSINDVICEKITKDEKWYDIPGILRFAADMYECNSPLEKAATSNRKSDEIGFVETMVYQSVARDITSIVQNRQYKKVVISDGIDETLNLLHEFLTDVFERDDEETMKTIEEMLL